MGKVTNCYFSLTSKETPVYRPGDSLIGKVVLEVSGEISANAVRLSCFGKSLTKWRPIFTGRHASDPRAKESYLDRTILLAGGKGTLTLTEGTHNYPFCFELPNDALPSSYEGEPGAIRYWLKLRVDKTFPGIDFVKSKTFTFLSDVNMGLSPCKESVDSSSSKTLSKFMGVGNAGELHLAASLDRCGYCPGEKVMINLEARNESTKDCGKVRAKLMQRVFYSVGEDTDTKSLIISNVTKGDETLKKGEKIVWNKIYFVIPAVPPSTKLRSCHNIKVDYYVKLEIEVGGGFDLELTLPIIIGTIPAGVTRSVKKFKTPDGRTYNRVIFSPPLTYKECTKGFQHCSKTDSDLPFPDLFCTPYTVFHDGSSSTTQKSVAKVTPTAPKVTPTASKVTPTASKVTPTAPPQGTSQSAQGASASTCASAPVMNPDETLPKYSEHASQAPPLEAPPSYDSIFLPSENTSASESANTSTSASASASASAPNQEWKGVTLGLIFPEIQLAQMMNYMKTYSSNLTPSDGIMLGVFDKFPIFAFKPSSAIFVVFPCEKSAMTWFDHFQWSNPIPDIHVLFAENSVAYPRPQDPKLYPFIYMAMSYKTCESDLTKEEIKEYSGLRKNIFISMKEKFGGKNIISSSKVKYVKGDWSDIPCSAKDISLIIHHWPSREHFVGYTNGYKQHQDYDRFSALYYRKSLTTVTAETNLKASSDLPEGHQYWRGAVLGLVFPQSDMARAMECMRINLKSLTVNDGKVIAVFDEFLMTPSSSKSAIFVIFPSEATARVWFRHFQSVNPIPDINIMYAENYLPKVKPMDSKLYPAVSLAMSYRTDYKHNQELMELSELSKTIFPPLREQFGGKPVLASNSAKFLSGDWSNDIPCSANNITLVITQWATTDHQEAYKNEIKAHPDYNKYEELKKRFYSETIPLVTMFKEEEVIGLQQ